MQQKDPSDIKFACTTCGRCCHDLKLPLTVAEAITWLSEGHDVQILCEAMPWGKEPGAEDRQAAHRRRRSFAASSGALPIRVVVVLAGAFAGACPNLLANNRCGIYERRPLVCRIYPAEISPFISLQPEQKVCPPEAWGGDRPILMRHGLLVDHVVQGFVQQSREADVNAVLTKQALCAALGIVASAIADEGFVIYSPGRMELLDALTRLVGSDVHPEKSVSWQLVSNQKVTLNDLARLGALGALPSTSADAPAFDYLGFRRGGD